jgi:hypothetical protein
LRWKKHDQPSYIYKSDKGYMIIDDAVVTNLVDGVDPYSSLHGWHSETMYLIQIAWYHGNIFECPTLK